VVRLYSGSPKTRFERSENGGVLFISLIPSHIAKIPALRGVFLCLVIFCRFR
jgi:hypothetical protein